MADNQLYTLTYVTVDGMLLTEHADMTLTRNGNGQPVRTMVRGLAGQSPGAADCTIDVTNAVPAADFEFDPGDAIADNKVVEIGVIGPGGKSGISKGFIQSDTFRQGVGNEATLAFRFMGSFPRFK